MPARDDRAGQQRGQQRRAQLLPVSLPPLGLSREQAAAYIGISPVLFDDLVRDGRMPQPKCLNRRLVWDRRGLDSAFAELPDRQAVNGPMLGGETGNPWDA